MDHIGTSYTCVSPLQYYHGQTTALQWTMYLAMIKHLAVTKLEIMWHAISKLYRDCACELLVTQVLDKQKQ